VVAAIDYGRKEYLKNHTWLGPTYMMCHTMAWLLGVTPLSERKYDVPHINGKRYNTVTRRAGAAKQNTRPESRKVAIHCHHILHWQSPLCVAKAALNFVHHCSFESLTQCAVRTVMLCGKTRIPPLSVGAELLDCHRVYPKDQ
jgi:hypothetical protein